MERFISIGMRSLKIDLYSIDINLSLDDHRDIPMGGQEYKHSWQIHDNTYSTASYGGSPNLMKGDKSWKTSHVRGQEPNEIFRTQWKLTSKLHVANTHIGINYINL